MQYAITTLIIDIICWSQYRYTINVCGTEYKLDLRAVCIGQI